MKIFYSASTRGFYLDEIHPSIPQDAIEITEEEHRALLEAQSKGKAIISGEDGRPVVSDRPAPAPETLAEMLKAQAKAALDASDVVVLRCYENDLLPSPAWKTYRQTLRDIISGRSAATELPAHPEYPEVESNK